MIRLYRAAVGDRTLARCRHTGGRYIVVPMALSARNQLKGEVKEVRRGDIMAHVVMQVGEHEIESVITRRSADDLDLKPGAKVTVVIKSTEVMIQK